MSMNYYNFEEGFSIELLNDSNIEPFLLTVTSVHLSDATNGCRTIKVILSQINCERMDRTCLPSACSASTSCRKVVEVSILNGMTMWIYVLMIEEYLVALYCHLVYSL